MLNEFFLRLLEYRKEDPLFIGILFIVLVILISTAFARENTHRFLWGIIKVVGRYLIAPFIFVAKYVTLTYRTEKNNSMEWVAHRAPLSMASVTFLGTITAFSGILILAGTLLIGGKTLLPDPSISRTLRFLNLQMEIEKIEQDSLPRIKNDLKKAEEADPESRIGLLKRVRDEFIPILVNEEVKYKKAIENRSSAKKELDRVQSSLRKLGNTFTDREMNESIQAIDQINFKIKDEYNMSCISAYLGLRSREAALSADWSVESPYIQFIDIQIAHSGDNNRSLLSDRIAKLEIENQWKWASMGLALATGLGLFWAYVAIGGLLVELLNLLLGHFEWLKQIQAAVRKEQEASNPPIPETVPASQDSPDQVEAVSDAEPLPVHEGGIQG